MNKKWMMLLMMLLVPAMLFTTSCTKKATLEDGPGMASQDDDAARQARLEEERLAAEKMQRERAIRAAKERFLNEHIYFDFDSSVLTSAAQVILKTKAEWLYANPSVNVVIEGHCDERGTTAYNLALGERRAESAKAFLVNMGIPHTRLTTISYGEEMPLDPGHHEAAWVKNRRTAFVLE
ncbi:peptidoglycan-associated lipoprotein Pal [Desulfosarcina sp. OttesenSCG-928-G10]|nr:peptidoglycan-associated lipoprotein Pal [Desulfosarcina sp. OttesenSCG-928-G10]